MFVVENENNLSQYTIAGSTYDPIGDIKTLKGDLVKCSQSPALVELATIMALCNDSSLDYNDVSYYYYLY